VNTPEQYVRCHYLPTSYDVIAGHTPETVWLTGAAIPDDWLSRALRAMPFFQGLSATMQAKVYQTIAEEYRDASPEKRAKMKVELGVADG
jgi:hypothetical protein